MIKKMFIGIAFIVITLFTALFLLLRIPILDISKTASYTDKVHDIDKWLSHLNQSDKFNGAVLLAKNSKVIFEKYYGYNGTEGTDKLNSKSSFNLASVSKQFTAMGIIILKNKKLIEFDDDIST